MQNSVGAITMMHMVEEFEPAVLFDCIWLFRPSHKYYNFNAQRLYMKVITMNDLGEKIQYAYMNTLAGCYTVVDLGFCFGGREGGREGTQV